MLRAVAESNFANHLQNETASLHIAFFRGAKVPKISREIEADKISLEASTIDGDNLYGQFHAVSTDSTGQFVAAIDYSKGVYYSSDYGQSYDLNTSMTYTSGFCLDVAIAGSIPVNLVIACQNGLYYSTDGTTTFTKATCSTPAEITWECGFKIFVRSFQSITLLSNSPMGRFMTAVLQLDNLSA